VVWPIVYLSISLFMENEQISPGDNLPPESQPAELPQDNRLEPPNNGSRWGRFKAWYTGRKKLSVPLTILFLLVILAVIPFSRYALAGTVYKKDFTLKVTDSTAHTPVSGATVSAGGVSAQTDSEGNAKLHLKVGPRHFTVNKKYYQQQEISFTVPMFKHGSAHTELTATGRQVKVTVSNLIDKSPLENVSIKAAGVTAKTDKSGTTVMVLPAGADEQKASLSLNGYNDKEVTLKVSGDKVEKNNLNMTPSGKVYFLSKLSGKIDVVKTNLDGTERETVLAGTGKEDSRNTVLLASRDWKYLALLSKRAGGSPSLYLINTAGDDLSTIDPGTDSISLNGWVGDNFVYTVTKDQDLWEPGRQAVKSFNAAAAKNTVLDQTVASGTDDSDYIAELVGDVYVYNGQVYYIKNWTRSFDSPDTAAFAKKQATLNSIKPDGSAKRAIKSFGLAPSATDTLDISLDDRIENPYKIELRFYDGTKTRFYSYSNGQVQSDTSVTDDSFYDDDYPTYLQSPAGDQTFWSESRDGKNTLFLGDQSGQNGKQIASLSDYVSYGWYTDNYVLVSKNSSELYIMPAKGSDKPIKISDYHKPARSFYGYGGGYGGL